MFYHRAFCRIVAIDFVQLAYSEAPRLYILMYPLTSFVKLQFHFSADFDKLYIIRKLTLRSKQIYKYILSFSSDFDSPASYNFNCCKYHTVLEFQNLDLRLTCSYFIPICSVYIWSSVLKITSCLGEQNSVYDRKKICLKTKVIKE